MIDLDKVYYLECAMKRTALHVDTASEEPIDDRALCLGEWVPDAPLVFQHHSGSRLYDVITTTYACLELISQRMAEALTGFTGWNTWPVRVLGKNKEPIEGYQGLAITGRCGPIDRTKGRQLWGHRLMAKGAKRSRRRFFYFDPATWDGRDMFVPEGMAYIFVVEDVMFALKRAKISNINMWRLSEF